MATYRHSGAMPLVGLLLILVSGLVTAVVLGIIYSFAIVYIPLVYFNVLVTLAFGWVIGLAIGWAAKVGKVRNHLLLGVYGVAFGTIGLYAAWGADPLARFPNAWQQFGLQVFHPNFLRAYIQTFYDQGFWMIGHAGGANNPNVNGVFLGGVWLCEACMILGVATRTAYKSISSLPFCEKCNRWTQIEPDVQRLTPHSGQGDAFERLREGDLAALADFTRSPRDATSYWQLDLAQCPECQTSSFLSLHSVQHTVDKNGKRKVVRTAVLANLIIDAADVPLVREAGQVPPPPEESQLPEFLQSPKEEEPEAE